MVLGKWGTFWRFILLAGGIGGISGICALAVVLAISLVASGDGFSLGEMGELIAYTAIAFGIGAGLGVVMGIPGNLVLQKTAPHLHTRLSSVVFCFALGFIAALTPILLISMASGSFIRLNPGEEWLTMLLFCVYAVPAGIVTACATPLIVVPADASVKAVLAA